MPRRSWRRPSPWLPPPAAAAWPCLAASAVLQVGYSVFLALAYRHGELGQVYPIVRGSAPPLVTLGGFLFAGQKPNAPTLFGVGLISLGVLSLASSGGRAHFKSLALALVTGAFVAAYVTVDGIGVRLSAEPRAYAAWLFIIYGAFQPLAYLVMRRRFAVDIFGREGLKAMAGGGVSILAYGAVLSALALGPLGPVAALRETSVVFSALIARFFLSEPLTRRRLLACATVTLGAITIGVAS